jgi:hypothetical protein
MKRASAGSALFTVEARIVHAAELKPEEFAHNGAIIVFDHLLQKWAIFNCHAALVGYRRDQAVARAFASGLPGTPPEPEPPPPIRRSPRALPLPPAEPEAEVIPADMRVDFFEL